MVDNLLGAAIAYYYNGNWIKTNLSEQSLSRIQDSEINNNEIIVLLPEAKITLIWHNQEKLWYSADPSWAEFIMETTGVSNQPSILSNQDATLSDPSLFSTYPGYTGQYAYLYAGTTGGQGGTQAWMPYWYYYYNSPGSSSGERYSTGIATKNAATETILGFAPLVRDLDENTYEIIGANGVRYIMHDFGGKLDQAIPVTAIEWVVTCSYDKTYAIEVWNGNEWIRLVAMKCNAGEAKRWGYRWGTAQYMYAVRIYYTGDYETATDTVTLAISSVDYGSGNSGYKISNFEDFRDDINQAGADVDGWVPLLSNGLFYKDWNLQEISSLWSNTWALANETVKIMTVYNSILIVGTKSGKIYYSTDASTLTLAHDYGIEINCFAEYNDYLYIGLKNGYSYRSSNGTSWGSIYSFKVTSPTLNINNYNGILSMTIFDSKLYIGTDYKTVHCWDGNILTLKATFLDHGIDSLISRTDSLGSDTLFLSTEPSGKIYHSQNGSTFYEDINTKLTYFCGSEIYGANNYIYMYGDKGQIYEYNANQWSLFYDTAATKIVDATNYVLTGPTILDAYEDGTGDLLKGTYKYAISFVDFDDNQSLIGELYEIKALSNASKIALLWEAIGTAKSYNIYRTSSPDVSDINIKLLASGVTDTEYTDDGSSAVTDIAPPTSAKAYIWFLSNNGFSYFYNNITLKTIELPDNIYVGSSMAIFRSQLFIAGLDKNTGLNTSIYKYTGSLSGSGNKTVYFKAKDALGNETDTISDEIYFSNTYENSIIEINPSGQLVDVYQSVNDPPFKLVSPHKDLYREGIYESEYFYVSELSRWDKIQYYIFLPDGCEFELYARTAEDRDDLEEQEWYGPATETNPVDNGYDYDFYYDYEGDDYYTGPYDVYYRYNVSDPGYFVTGSLDISTLRGKWIQFKIVFKTYVQYLTPIVYSVIIRYISTNAVRFYTILFNLEDMVLSSDDTTDLRIKRGLLTYNGSIPDGGKIEFGITTRDSFNWNDYQVIEPNQIFEVEDKTGEFRVGIVLVSTPEDIAVVHEWALTFDTGTTRVYANQ